MVGFLKRIVESFGPKSARIEPFGANIEVASDETLLEAALKQGVAFPHNCTVGTCGSCKCRLVSGRVGSITDFGYTLSREELEAGFILACQATLKTPVVIEVESPAADMPPPETFSAKIANIETLTHDIRAVTLNLDRPIRYVAGQYADLTIGGLPAARSYSFASPPERNGSSKIMFFIRKVPGGAFTERLFSGELDDAQCSLNGPHGMFYLRPGDTAMICIAGGSGLAPLISLLQDARKNRVRRRCILLFGARTQADLYALEQIEDISQNWQDEFTFVPVLSHEPDDSGWTGRRGMVTDAIGDFLPPGDAATFEGYMCGPPPMIDAAIPRLTAAGIPITSIHYDKFTDASHGARHA